MAKVPGMIRKRGRGWNVVLRVNGKRHEFGPRADPVLVSGSRNDIEVWTWRKFHELTEAAERNAPGARLDVVQRLRLSELFDRFESERLPPAENTRRTYRISLKAFRTFFGKYGDPSVADIRRRHIREFLNWRARHSPDGKDATIGARTVAKDRTVLHAVFAFAEELEARDGNPVKGVRPPKVHGRDPVILTPAQLDALLDACERDENGHLLPEREMVRMFILLAAETGARSESEVLWIRWEHLDLDGGFIWIASDREHRTKGGKGRWTPMTPRLRQALIEHSLKYRGAHYDGRKSPWVLHHTAHRRHAKAGDRFRSLRRAFKGAARRAGLPDDLNQHDLRHTRVTTWLAEGRDVVLVKEAVGHSDVRTTMGYTHLAREHLRALVDDPAEARQRPAGSR